MHNGHGIDMGVLGLACDWFGITDVAPLIERLLVIKQHNRKGSSDGTGDTEH